ncbi:MAG: DUF4738 domain-containing protein [Prevotella sp.]|uniref:DUF4738 domain-containing protein n=1 Tax=Prevotella sp. TaxID=59823 RepID=UPI002A2A4417|nr:DUF4738 domain-containing protein [Prevotella sp.]MDD7319171.1 DUF4738 domain-containing protein [Prevotellaceae bacterium]MDY4020039.1 DUF4738 domain-containing protein [Prevotella sp.]
MKYLKFALLASVCLLSACKEEKKNTDIITQKPVIVKKSGPEKMGDTDDTQVVQWLGKTYTIEIHRRADTELPVTRDESGAEYYDNRVSVKVLRPDGTEFFSREYTKLSFREYLNESTIKDGALLAVVFTEVKGDRLVFAASVGSPDSMSDEYIPLVLTVSRMGDVHVERDNRIDDIPDSENESVQDVTEDEEGV